MRTETRSEPQSVEALPFVCLTKTGKDYWNVAGSESGDWKKDNALGRDMAARLIDCMHQTEAPFLLGHVVNAMADKKRIEGIEIGFLHGIAEAAMSTAEPTAFTKEMRS